MLTALFKFIATGAGAGVGEADFLGDSHFSLAFAVAVTVIPRVARMFATALASDFFGLCETGGGLRTDSVIESDRCITFPSARSGVPP